MRASRQGGWTLLEMLIVMTVIATLFAIGAGVFQGLGEVGKRRAAQQGFMNLVRIARNSANGGDRSAIVVEQSDGQARARAMIQKTVGQWQCEEIEDGQTVGADRKNGKVPGGEHVAEGKIGGAIRLRGGSIDCGKYPDYEVTDGVGVSLYVMPEDLQDMTLVRKGRSWGLMLERDGSILKARAWVLVGRGGSSSPLEVSAEKPIPVGVWTRISFSYDRDLMVLKINDIEGARYPPDPEPGEDGESEDAPGPETRPIVRDKTARLEIGPIFGMIDDVKVTGVLSGDTVTFPEDVDVKCSTPRIRFMDEKLDREFHSVPVEITMDFGGKRRRKVFISLSGVASER